MRKSMRLSVVVLTAAFSMYPFALRAQDSASLSGGAGISMAMPLQGDALYDGTISPDQTISMDLQDANLRDILKIFSIQSGLNFIASDTVENKKITLYLDKVPIKLAMDKLFDTNKLVYEFDEDAGIFVVRGKEENVDLITEMFKLKNRSISTSNMEKQRIGLFSGTLTNAAGGAQATAAAEASDIRVLVQQLLSPVGKVSEDNKTNSIIVTDVPNRFPQIRNLIASLDVQQSQVMLDVEMLDVSRDLVDKLGFNFGENPIMSLGMAMGTKGLSFPFKTAPFKNASSSFPLRSSGLLSFSYGDATPWTVTFDLLKSDSSTKLLARPRILTLNYETAEIGITKDEVVSSTVEVDEDTGNKTYTYERSSSLDLTPEGIGIYLRVTPMINEDTGDIILVVNPKSSSTNTSTVTDPTTSATLLDPEVRASKSIIRIKDGETIVIGGLIKMEKEVTKTKIPMLGDIPVLGMMFRGKDQSKNVERELLVFITPHIVKDKAAPLSQSRGATAPTGANRRRSQDNKVTLFTRHEAVNTALNNLDR